ncbi:MAG: signal transduction histidine kinase [Phenylobacterium sp.]|jgi:signal transduction histidine kinase
MMDDEIVKIKALLTELAGGDKADPEVLQSFEQMFASLDDLKDTAIEGTRRIKKIVEGLRFFTHLDATEQKEVAVADLIESTVHLIRTQYNEIDIKIELGCNAYILCFPSKLGQVLMNIIINACQAVEDCSGEVKGEVIVSTQQAVANRLKISIKDNGAGMDEATMNRVFEPFFTTKEVGRGTGLGMAISFGIIQEHDGTIDIASTVGVGTTMDICLPMLV